MLPRYQSKLKNLEFPRKEAKRAILTRFYSVEESFLDITPLTASLVELEANGS